jgi:hypothetical protein
MHMAAVAWLNLAKGYVVGLELLEGLISPSGLRVSSTPLTSASDSRDVTAPGG